MPTAMDEDTHETMKMRNAASTRRNHLCQLTRI
jgi:hypothetical protein